jgi:hypothetical protein
MFTNIKNLLSESMPLIKAWFNKKSVVVRVILVILLLVQVTVSPIPNLLFFSVLIAHVKKVEGATELTEAIIIPLDIHLMDEMLKEAA